MFEFFFQQVYLFSFWKGRFLPSENCVSSLFLCPCHSGRYIPPDRVASSIPFPLARPTTNNILAICQYNNLRPRYTKDKLPEYGYLHRQADAINQLESWFAVCCSNGTQDEEVTLCCAQQVVRTQADCLHIILYTFIMSSYVYLLFFHHVT